MTKKKKDSAAVTLGRKGGIARRKALTPERRSAIARKAVLTRYGKATEPPPADLKPRWWGLFATDHFPTEEMVLFSRDKAELRERAKAEPDRGWIIEELDHDPESRLLIVPKYEPDTAACLRALQDLEAMQDVKTGKRGRS